MFPTPRKPPLQLAVLIARQRFRDAALELGAVALPVLQSRIDRFIAVGGRDPHADME